MCGLFGILHDSSSHLDDETVSAAFNVQAHRGPDGQGHEVDEFGARSLLIAHQRLAIIDLTDAGRQPMRYGSGGGSLVFNGELYNYIELREELAREGERFSTRSDTEVLLAALHRWGAVAALERFNWMGAFAWLDRRSRRLVLAADAGSEKPLYYYCDGRLFAFASEIKTLLTILGKRFELNRDVVGQFLFQGLSDASTQTLFSGITRLQPGSCAELAIDAERLELVVTPYKPPSHQAAGASLDLPEFIEQLRETFVDAVRIRLRSDVPVGVLLSGGIDSSSIAAVASKLRNENAPPPTLLSAISNDPRFDESAYIGAMEQHLEQKSNRIVLPTEPANLLSSISNANWYNDAPIAGLSAVGHFRLMECAKHLGVTVILSGQGADEILLGYRKFLGFYLQSLLRRGRVLEAAQVLSAFARNRSIVTQFEWADAKRYLPSLRKILGGSRPGSLEGPWLAGWRAMPLGLGGGSLADRQLLDFTSYSVPSLCHYEDRMSMAMSREIRLPFLDPRLVDLALRAPDDYKLRSGWTKYAFRRAMESLLPPQIAWRKDKQGFSNPEGEWLKSELRPHVLDAFSNDSLIVRGGIVDGPRLMQRYRDYCKQPVGRGRIWYREIFAPLSLELWMRRYAAWIG